MTYTNGGFPPIKYSKKNKKDKEQTKERFFVGQNKNINIRQLLYTKKPKPMINIDQSNEMIEIIDEL